MRFWSGSEILKPTEAHRDIILVVGSNPEGRHGLGLAKVARDYWGAKYGVGRGLTGRCYMLVTKNLTANYYEKSSGITYKRYGYRSVSREQIVDNIKELYRCAGCNKKKGFVIPYQANVSSLNGYGSSGIIKLFVSAAENDAALIPNNIIFHCSFKGLFNSLT